MRFTEDPLPLPAELYREAARRYAELTRRRALAVYQVGSVRHPGLSDLDLLVVPFGPRWDNDWFFSAKRRLPASMRDIFRHEPRLIPRSLLRAIRYTTHRSRRLLAGRDLLAGLECLDTPEQGWSILLEGYLKYHRYYWQVRADGTARIPHLLTKLASLPYSLAILDRLVGTKLAPDVERDAEEIRGSFFARGGPAWVRALHAWERYCEAFDAFDRELALALPLHSGDEPQHFCYAFLAGERSLPGLDEEALAERRQTVERYHRELGHLRFFRGSLFFKAAYEDQTAKAERRNRPSPLLLKLGRLLYPRS